MKKSLLIAIVLTGIAGMLAFSLVPGALSAPCHPDFWSVTAGESPETDENQNGLICKYVRSAPPAADVTVYLDD